MKLQAIKIEKSYKSRKVVDSVDLELNQGEIVGLLGPNGAGKTTCFYMIVGLIKSNSGKILIDKIDVSEEPMYKRAINGIGYLAQEASVFRKLSVEDNIKAVLELGNLTKKEQNDKLESLIDEFSLGKVRKSRGDLLSGGERRRTEIARALANDPDAMTGNIGTNGNIAEAKLGDLEVKYNTNTQGTGSVNNIMDVFPWLQSYLGAYILGGAGSFQMRVVRGEYVIN